MDTTETFRTVSACLVRRLPEVYSSLDNHRKMPSELHLKQYRERELKEATEQLRLALIHLNRFIEGD